MCHHIIRNILYSLCLLFVSVGYSFAQPAAPILAPDTVHGCTNVPVNISASIPGNPPNTVVRWYDDPTGGTLLFTGNTYTTSSATATTIKVYAESYDNATMLSSSRVEGVIIIHARPTPKNLGSPTSMACSGTTIPIYVLTPAANQTYDFYTQASGGTFISTNDTLFAGPLFNNTGAPKDTTFYMEVVSEFGCVSTSRTSRTLTVNPIPDIQASASETEVCAGEEVTLSVTGGSNYVWDSFIQEDVAFRIFTTTEFTVEGENGFGCTNSDQVTITVNQPPVVVPMANPNPICEGDSAQLTASGALTYVWEDGAINNGDFVKPVVSTDYTVIGEDANGCKDTATVSLTVNPKPVVMGTADPNPICLNESAQLLGSGANTYVWDDGAINDGDFVSPNTTTDYKVVGINGLGCKDSTIVTLIVNPLPVVAAIADPTAVVCEKETILLYGSATGNGPFTYTWTNGVTDNVPFPAVSTQTYTVTATDANGCENTDDILVTVNPQPDVTATANPTILCRGQSAQLIGGGADTYVWENGALADSAFVSPNAGRTYTVVGTDLNGCKDTASVFISVEPKPTVDIFVDETEICAGESVNLTAFGIPGGTYNWLNPVGFTGGNDTPSITTTYVVEGVHPTTGCRDTAEQVITVNPLPTVNANALVSSTVCFGDSVTLFGDGNALSYSWNKGVQDNVIFQPAGTDTYTVTGIDANGCENTDDILVTVNPLPNVTANANPNPICIGDQTQLTGAGAVSYEWEGGAINDGDFSSPTTDSLYTVIGTDVNGCKDTADVLVTVNPLPIVQANASVNPLCLGESTVLTGSGADTYVWDGGNFLDGATVSPVSDTIYYLVGTDANNCSNNAQISIVVNDLPTVTASVNPSGFICPGDSAQLASTASGNAPFTYTWNDGSSNGDYVKPVTTTTYTVTATDANNCSNTDDVTVNVYPKPMVVANATPSAICIGDSARLTATGGIVYEWENGAINDGDFVKPTTTTAYTVIGTDANGCTDTSTVTVIVDQIPTVIATVDTDWICAGQTVTPTGQGANTYTWSNGATDGVPVVLSDSTYLYVTGRSLAGCENTDSVYVNVKPLPVVVANADTTEICEGLSVTLSGSGANTYTWDPSGVNNGVPFFPTATNTYTVTGIDVDGCENTDQITITVNPGPTVVANASSTSICEGDDVTLTGSGANTYTWTGGVTDGVPTKPANTTTYTVTGTDANGCTGTDQVTINVSPAPTITIAPNQDTVAVCIGDDVILSATGAGGITWSPAISNNTPFQPTTSEYYVASGTDGVGCTGKDSIYVLVSPLPTVVANADNNPVCIGDTVRLFGSGATSYTWAHGVADSGKTVITSPSQTFTVTGTNPGGCFDTDAITINGLAQPNIIANSTKLVICEGESIILTGSGGASYEWNNGVVDGVSFQPTVTDDYIVKGFNAGGCFNFDTLTITVNPIPNVLAGATRTNICIGDSVTFKGSGADTYTWDNGIVDGGTYSVTSNTTYTVTGTSNGCSQQSSVSITVNPQPTVVPNASATTICEGEDLILSGSGLGSGGIYTWDNGVGNGVAFKPNTTTNYRLIGENNIGCLDTAFIQVTVMPAPNVVANASANTICIGDSVILNASGANNYVWNNGVQNNKAFAPTVSANYIVTGTGANNCIAKDTIAVFVNPLPNVSIVLSTTIICEGDSITLQGVGADSYAWDNGVIDNQPFVPKDTTYRLIGTDVNGCAKADSITIEPIAKPTVIANASALTVCENEEITFTGSGTADTYVWKNGVPNDIPFPVTTSGDYTVYGTSDITGCSDSATVSITVNPAPNTVISYIQGQQNICLGDTVQLNISGGATVEWDNGETLRTVSRSPQDTTWYYVTVRSNLGCESIDSVQVNVKPSPIVEGFFKDGRDTVCKGDETFLFATGGTTRQWIPNITENVPFTATTTTQYIVRGSENGCIGRDTLNLVVKEVPSFQAVTYTFVPCANDTFFFDAEPDDVGLSFTWKDANGNSFANETWQDLNGSQTYTLYATSPFGCLDSIDVPLAVNDLPNVIAGLSETEICVGDSSQLLVSGITLPISFETYLRWEDEDGNTFFNEDFVFPTKTTKYVVSYQEAVGTCLGTDTVTLTVNPLPTVNAGLSDPIICIGDSSQLIATGNAMAYDWEEGTISNNAFVSPTETTSYTARGISPEMCESTSTVTLVVEQKENPDAPIVSCPSHTNPNTAIFSWATIANATAYEYSKDGGTTWETPTSGASGTEHVAVETDKQFDEITLQFRSVRVSVECGTFYSATITTKSCPVKRYVDTDADIYNSFSPNGDGSNDFWYITEGIENYPDNQVSIYNRWGVKVFETTGYDNDKNVFNGDGYEDGAYFYVLQIPSIGLSKTGYVMIIR